jgi:hypothetical protein
VIRNESISAHAFACAFLLQEDLSRKIFADVPTAKIVSENRFSAPKRSGKSCKKKI